MEAFTLSPSALASAASMIIQLHTYMYKRNVWVEATCIINCYICCSETTLLFMHCITWPKLCRACVGSFLYSHVQQLTVVTLATLIMAAASSREAPHSRAM